MSNNRPSRYAGPGGIAGGFSVQNIQRNQPTSFRNLNMPSTITNVQSQPQSLSQRQQQGQILLNRQWRINDNDIDIQPKRKLYKQMQPKTNLDIDSQLEFLKIELDRLNRIKQNIIRIGRKSDKEKQLILYSKFEILLMQENFLASIYDRLTQVYENF